MIDLKKKKLNIENYQRIRRYLLTQKTGSELSSKIQKILTILTELNPGQRKTFNELGSLMN